jgi:signal transduction histidine kinase
MYVLLGIGIMLTLIIGTILLPIIIANSSMFLPYSPLYSLVFLGLTAFAITKYRLFNMKVLVAEALTLLICIILFAKMFGEESVNARAVDGIALAFMVVVGFFLIRSVRREVEQRETIERQEKELEQINAQQESLLHFISHEIKGYLTKGQNAFAGIIEGDYGDASTGVKALATGALHEMRKGVSTVMDILDASNYKKGTMTFDKKPFDIKKAVLELSDELRFMAEEKGLHFEITFSPTGEYMVVGDEPKLRRHVLRNLIENSIRYTPKGKVTVSLSRVDKYIRFSVTDTGVGITDEDKRRLFTQGGRGKDSIKTNVDSTGYGLFVAKQVTDAHSGRISAHSDGAGKGATFTVDLPAA